MKAAFHELADRLVATLRPGESLLLDFAGERSDFVRFNRARVRQAGSVSQRSLELRLLRARRQAMATIELCGGDDDFAAGIAMLERLRGVLEVLPEDPWLLVNEAPWSGERVETGGLADPEDVVEETLRAAGSADLVGLYAGGEILRGFASSWGQRNWHALESFHFDFSVYGAEGRAVKSGYAGFEWDAKALASRIGAAAADLERLAQPSRTLAPGDYRVWLAPAAVEEIMQLLCWGGFSARARETRQSPLLAMEQGLRLDARVSIAEHTAGGLAPDFQADGFARPARVPLIDAGRLGEPLVSPRSAREYDRPTNGADDGESPESLAMAPGALARGDVLDALGTGLYVSNLWYLNWSDRPAARLTGMTRFATLWVEGGRVVGPVAPMRFDDSLMRMLGDNLVEIGAEAELIPDGSTYGGRSTASMRLPGLLLSSLRLTL